MPRIYGEKRTSALRRVREKRNRLHLVIRTPIEETVFTLADAFKGLAKKNLVNAEITLSSPVLAEDRLGGCDIPLRLVSGDSLLAHSEVGLRVRKGKRELVIKYFQGFRCASIEDFERANANFTKIRRKNDQSRSPWNVIFIQSIVDAAYESGFDRVLLADPKYIDGYANPKGIRRGDTPEKVRMRMDNLYGLTRKDCGFTKDESIDTEHYWVREFP